MIKKTSLNVINTNALKTQNTKSTKKNNTLPKKEVTNTISFSGLDAISIYNKIKINNKKEININNTDTDNFIKELKKQASKITTTEWQIENGKKQKFKLFNGTQKGTNEGLWALNEETNELFYAKFPNKSDLHGYEQAKIEVFSSKVYQLLGENVPEMQLIETPDGKIGTISKYIPNMQPIQWAEEKLNSGFGADIFLANWDAVISNNAQLKEDKVYRIDFGGTLHFRAQGQNKAFGIVVDELTTMIDPEKNYAASEFFSKMTKDDLIQSLEKVANLNESELKKLANEYSIDKKFVYTLLKRKEFLSYALKIIKDSKSEQEINLDYLQEVKEKILKTPLNELKTSNKENNTQDKKNSFPSLIKTIFTKKSNDYSSLIKKMIQQRNSIPEFYEDDVTNNQCLGEIKIFYGQMNHDIRHGKDYHDEQLDYIMENSKLPENATLYRGCTPYDFGSEFSPIPADKFLDYFFKEGEYFKIPIYPNTTLDKELLKEKFAFPINNGKIIFKINAPKGSNGVYMEELSNKECYTKIGNEEEVLLNKNLTYRFKSRTKYFGRDIVEIDLIPNPPKNAQIHDFKKELQEIKKADKYDEYFYN